MSLVIILNKIAIIWVTTSNIFSEMFCGESVSFWCTTWGCTLYTVHCTTLKHRTQVYFSCRIRVPSMSLLITTVHLMLNYLLSKGFIAWVPNSTVDLASLNLHPCFEVGSMFLTCKTPQKQHLIYNIWRAHAKARIKLGRFNLNKNSELWTTHFWERSQKISKYFQRTHVLGVHWRLILSVTFLFKEN